MATIDFDICGNKATPIECSNAAKPTVIPQCGRRVAPVQTWMFPPTALLDRTAGPYNDAVKCIEQMVMHQVEIPITIPSHRMITVGGKKIIIVKFSLDIHMSQQELVLSLSFKSPMLRMQQELGPPWLLHNATSG